MENQRKAVALIGLGNLLMSDEGVGVRVVEEIRNEGWVGPDVDLIDLGAAGFHALHEMAGREKVVFVDCAYMDEEPGTLRRFTPEEAVSRKVRTRFSVHEGDLIQTIDLSRQLGECPDRVVLFGIQPAHVGPGDQLSIPLANRLHEFVKTISEEFKGLTIEQDEWEIP